MCVRTRYGTGATPPCCFSWGEKGIGKLVLCYQYEPWRRRANLAAAADALRWWRCIAAEMAELCPNLAEMVELSASSSLPLDAKGSPLVDLGGENWQLCRNFSHDAGDSRAGAQKLRDGCRSSRVTDIRDSSRATKLKNCFFRRTLFTCLSENFDVRRKRSFGLWSVLGTCFLPRSSRRERTTSSPICKALPYGTRVT